MLRTIQAGLGRPISYGVLDPDAVFTPGMIGSIEADELEGFMDDDVVDAEFEGAGDPSWKAAGAALLTAAVLSLVSKNKVN